RINFGAKVPGPTNEIAPVTMEFRYASSFGVSPPEAYERLLLDALIGDSTLFIREDEVEASWGFITPILKAWAGSSDSPSPYPAGPWGPAEAAALMGAEGGKWRRPGAAPRPRGRRLRRASSVSRRAIVSRSARRRSSASWPACGARPASRAKGTTRSPGPAS